MRAFLFTDIEDSTVLWELHPVAMAGAVARHDRIVTGAVEAAGGRVVQRVGDAMDVVFADVVAAVAGAVAAQRDLAGASWGEVGPIRVRMAVDVGAVDEREGKFFGAVLNRAGRMLAAGHGGQVLVSADAAGRLDGGGDVGVRSLGEFRFKGLTGAQEVFQLTAEGLEERFPPLRVDHPAGDGAPRSGTVWGYELGEEVGAGRLGTVFRGRHASSGREVAVRVVDPELVNDPWFVRRFEAEARVVERLDHVHLVGLRDFWRDPDGAYLVMPWFEGGSLDDALERPWDVRSAAQVISQVGSALVYVHERGLVHGGVGPSNVLFDGDGEAHLSDVSVPARLLAGPEEEGGSAAEDVRGLARLVVAALTGHWPDGDTPPPAVSELRPEVDAEVDRVIARAVSPPAGGGAVTARGLLEVVLPALEAGLDVAGPVRNPYKGLAAFGEVDAVDFFGREDLLATLTSTVDEVPLVAVVGPSGSGKSSVVRAGLLPAVHRGELGGDWLVTDLMPGSEPFAELEAALLRVAVERPADLASALRSGPDGFARGVAEVLPDDGSRLLVLVDQFEELFSLVEDEDERQAFLGGLVALAERSDGYVRVVITLRADFFDRPLDYPEFGELLKEGLVPVTPLGGERLVAAIEGPARNVGAAVEPSLVSEIVGDVGDEPGRLPLVQFTMTELFERAEGSTLTLASYREAGGITGALARRAEEVHGGLPVEAREAARQVFLRLVALGEGAEDTRRRVPRGRLVSLAGQEELVDVVLDRFGQNRLLAFDRDVTTREPTVEVAHEALLRHWPRLRGWVDAAREDLRAHRRLREAVTQWQEAGEDETYLLSPGRVEATDEWLATAQVALSEDEARYLDASRARKHELEAAEAERAAHEAELERRAVRRLRTTVGVLSVGVLVAVALSVFAFDQRSQADTERIAAEEQRVAAEQERAAAERAERVATARGLASAAVAQLTEDPERSILLAIEAIQMTREEDGTVLPEAETALRRAIRDSHVIQRFESGQEFSVAPDGRVATLSRDGNLTVWDPTTGEAMLELAGMSSSPVNPGDGQITFLARTDIADFSPDGSSVVVADADLRGAIRDAETGDVLVELEGELTRPLFSPDGRLVAAISPQETETPLDAGRTIGIWDATTGGLLRLIEPEAGNVWRHEFNSEGDRLLASPQHAPVQMWDVETGDLVWSADAEVPSTVVGMGFHVDGERIAIGGEATVYIIDARDGSLEQTVPAGTESIWAVDLSPDGQNLAIGDAAGNIEVIALDTGEVLFEFQGHMAGLTRIRFDVDGARVTSGSEDDTVRIWDIGTPGGYEYATVPGVPGVAGQASFTPDGERLALGGMDGARVWDLATMEETLFLPHENQAHLVTISPDEQTIATATLRIDPVGQPFDREDSVKLWDATTGEERLTIDTDRHITYLDFSPDGSALAVVAGQVIQVLEVESGRETFAHFHELGPVLEAEFTPSGEGLVVAAQNAAFVLDPNSGEIIQELVRQETAVISVALTADGDHVVHADLAGRIRLSDLATGDELEMISQQPSAVYIDVWEDLLAIGRQGALAVRDLETGAPRFELAHENMWRPRFSPDGRYLVSGAWTPSYHIHVVRMEDLLGLAHDRLTRWWTDEECEEFLQGPCPERVAS